MGEATCIEKDNFDHRENLDYKGQEMCLLFSGSTVGQNQEENMGKGRGCVSVGDASVGKVS